MVQSLWTEAESAFGRLAALSGRRAVTLRVAASDYLGRALLAPALRDLLDEESGLRFEIVTTHSRSAMRLVEGGEVELAVVTGQDTPRGLHALRLFEQPFVWVGPRRARGGRAALTERLRREPVLRLAPESRGRALLDQCLAEARIQPLSTIDVPSVSLLLSYVSGGTGHRARARAGPRRGSPDARRVRAGPGRRVARHARAPLRRRHRSRPWRG